MFSLPEPKTIDEARRQIALVQRALEVIQSGYTFWKEDDRDAIAVCKPGTEAASYWINEGECTCPDFRHRGHYCKHTLAWGWWQNNVLECRLERRPATGEYTLFLLTKEDIATDEAAEAYAEMVADGETSTGCDYPEDF